jgi:predicted MFS family arabinose efflux permease
MHIVDLSLFLIVLFLKQNISDTFWSANFVYISIANLLMAIAFYFLIPTLPFYLETVLGVSRGYVGLVLAAYTIAALLVRPLTGMAVDRKGRKVIYLVSFLLFSLLFSAYIAATTLAIMVVIRILHGLTWGISTTAGSTVVVDIIPPARRGEGLGIFGLSMTIAMAIGPMFGLWLSTSSNYMRLFIGASLLSLAGFILILFVKYPRYTPPVRPEGIWWKNLIAPAALPVSMNYLIVMISYGGMLSFIAIYAREIGITNPGLFFLVYAIGITLSRLFAGRIFDRRGPFGIVIMGLMLLTTGFPILAFIQNGSGFFISSFILGLGSGIIMPTFQAMVNNLAGAQHRGAANSTLFTALDLGIGIGMIGMGLLSSVIGLSSSFMSFGLLNLSALLLFVFYTQRHYDRNLQMTNRES